MNPLQEIDWLPPLVEPRTNAELESWVKQHAGTVYPHTAYLADCPWIIRADVTLDTAFVHINDLTGLVYLTVSRDNSCRFCYGASRLFMRLAGMSESTIDQLERDIETAAVEPRTKLALDFARRVSRCNPVPTDADRRALLDAGFDETAVTELAFYATDVIFHNRFATLLALPPQYAEQAAEQGVFDRLREEFAKLFAQISTPVRPASLTEEQKSGPFANIVLALDGIVQAGILRTIIDEAWASPHLPARTKALIFGVIARGLGSAAAEREAYRLLAEEGMQAEAVDAALAHLSSPDLDDREELILPYVRETIWYRAAAAQRRGQELRTRLQSAAFVETVGAAALANMVCRLALVLDTA
jgi:alkylhydroperoxidase family enzyme